MIFRGNLHTKLMNYMNYNGSRWAVIINYNAGKHRIGKLWYPVAASLREQGVTWTEYSTAYAGHATELARQVVEDGVFNIIVVGGDGTIHEVVNGVFSSSLEKEDIAKVSMLLIPCGTGNDWARYWGLYRNKVDLVDILNNGRRVMVDVGAVSYHGHGFSRNEYFINGCGFGLDSQVVWVANKLKQRLGGYSWLYALSTVLTALTHKAQPMTFETEDGDLLERRVYSVSVGNGCYSGGGMQMNNGDPTDGKVFVTIVEALRLKTIVKGLVQLVKGNFWEADFATSLDSSSIKVSTCSPLLIEADGVLIDARADSEEYGCELKHYSIDTYHHAIGMIVP